MTAQGMTHFVTVHVLLRFGEVGTRHYIGINFINSVTVSIFNYYNKALSKHFLPAFNVLYLCMKNIFSSRQFLPLSLRLKANIYKIV